ncbi:MAG: hypothetical protein M3256_11110 [Actinomycetota bacterium]|nr:hypothetical protein [Actinomycetota bacterium]
MTDVLADALLLDAVRSELEPTATLTRAHIPAGTLWDHVLSSVAEWTGRTIPLFAADSAIPEIFCLDSAVSPAIVVNGTYFERLAKFRLAMFDPALGAARVNIIEQLFLETTAMHCLKVGDADVGGLLFQRSLHGRQYLVDAVQLYDSSDNNAESADADVIEGFFSVVHEIGHVNRDTASLIPYLKPISDSSLLSRLHAALDAMSWVTPEIRGYATKAATERSTSHILGLGNIRREGFADIFAAQRLYAFAASRALQNAVDFDPVAFMAVLHREFNIVNVLQRTKLIARMTSDYPLTGQNILDTMLYPVAIAMRHYLMQVGLLGFAKSYIAEESPLAPEGALLTEWHRVMSGVIANTIQECNEGMDRAINALTPELLSGARASLESTRESLGRSVYARLDAQNFLGRVRRLQADTPLLRTFRTLVDDPDGWDGNVEGEGLEFLLLLALSEDGKATRFFSLPLKEHPRAVCAFKSRTTLQTFADRFLAQYLVPGEKFGAAIVRAQHLSLLEGIVTKEVGEPITLIVEGSTAFDDLVNAVAIKKSGRPDNDGAAGRVVQRAADAIAYRYKLYTENAHDPATLEQFADILALIEDQ